MHLQPIQPSDYTIVNGRPYFYEMTRDSSAEQRKKDHIELAFEAQLSKASMDHRFDYEPIFAAHPQLNDQIIPAPILAGKQLKLPLWVSSMTGGTQHAANINRNLAQACHRFGMGMGLGSCRILLEGDEHFKDFDVRQEIGDDLPFFANMGIAQLEQIIENKSLDDLAAMIDKLKADGLIIHVNPLQEWFQPEGDEFRRPPIETIQNLVEELNCPLIVKEVGQGMGPRSLRALLQMPLEAIDFGAAGGTNFSLLEALRGDPKTMEAMAPLTRVGHTAESMVEMVNEIIDEIGTARKCNLIIVSGGIGNFLDGYYCMSKLNMPAIYGQASALLKRAITDVQDLYDYIEIQKRGLQMAYSFLKVK